VSIIDELNNLNIKNIGSSKSYIEAFKELEENGEIIEVKSRDVFFINGEYMVYPENNIYHNILTNKRGVIKSIKHLKELVVHED